MTDIGKSFLTLVSLFGTLLLGCHPSFHFADEMMENFEIKKLTNSFGDFKNKNGHWPTNNNWDSLKATDPSFKRFSNMDIKPTGDSMEINFRLDYEDFYNYYRTMEIKLTAKPFDSSFYASYQLKRAIIQGGVETGQRDDLTLKEKRKIKKWEKLRKQSTKLTIEKLNSTDKQTIAIGERLYVFSQKDSFNRYNWHHDKLIGDYFEPVQWDLRRNNKSDSTIDIELSGPWTLWRKLKYSDIDSIKMSTRKETYKIFGTE